MGKRVGFAEPLFACRVRLSLSRCTSDDDGAHHLTRTALRGVSRQRGGDAGAGRRSARQGRRDRARRRRGVARAARGARQAAAARARRGAARSGLAVSRTLAASPPTACTTATVPAAGIITGIGRVAGRECVIVANDATVKGGTYFPMTVKKHLRAQEIARENRLPCIYLVDSGGAFLPTQDEVFPDREHFGRIFYNQANLSALGIPQIAVVMGSCTAGGAYVPAMCDETIIVKRPGHDLSRRPAAGARRRPARSSRAEDLGGADVHSAHLRRRRPLRGRRPRMRSASRAASSRNLNRVQAAALAIARAARAALSGRGDLRRRPDRHARALRRARGHRAHRRRQRARRVQARSTARRWSAASRTSGGYPVGIVANNGILFSECALKGAHFIELCASAASRWCSCRTSPASWSAGNTRRGGIAKDGAKMVTAVATARGAEVHRHHRRQLRRRQLRHVRARLSAALPVDVAERAHLGDGRRAGRQRCWRTVRRDGIEARGEDWTAEEEEAFKAPIRDAVRDARAIRTTRPRGCGTTASSIRPRRAGCSALALSAA